MLRRAAEGDLDSCLALITDQFLYDQRHLAGLRGMWSHIIASGAGLTGVVVSRAPPQILSFATAVCVSDDRAERYQSCAQPRIGYGIAEEWNAGGHPFLEAEEIGAENAGAGLNVVVTHHGFVEGDEEFASMIRYAIYEVYRINYRGLNIRSWTHEVFDRYGVEVSKQIGFRVLRYTNDQLLAAGIPFDRAPLVQVATREDAVAHPGSEGLGLLFFSFSPPRFGFNLHEQKLLRLAIDGHTDETIALLTSESLSNVKKRFRTIYSKVEGSAIADAFPEQEALLERHRGVEVRRHLLNYLREHPEELHPYIPAKSTV